jgi:hypothetical protein
MLLNKWYGIILLLITEFQLLSIIITPVTGQPFSSGGSAIGIAYSPLIHNKFFSAVVNSTGTIRSNVVNSNGSFTPAGPLAATGRLPKVIRFSPFVNNKLFAATANDLDMSIFSVDPDTGILTLVLDSPVIASQHPQDIAFSQVINGTLYAVMIELTGRIHVYWVNTTTGAFIERAIVFSASSAQAVAISPLINDRVFVAVTASSKIFVYSLNIITGSLTQLIIIPSTQVSSIAFSPLANGNLFALTTDITGTTTSYMVNQITGNFTPVSTLSTGLGTAHGSFSPIVNNMLFAGIVNAMTNTISIFTVDMNTGALTELTSAGSPLQAGAQPQSISFSPVIGNTVFFATANIITQNSSVYKIVVPALFLQTAVLSCQTGLVTVTGSGASANGVIQVISDGVTQIGTAAADSNGNFIGITEIPLTTGNHTITIREVGWNILSNSIAVNCANLLYTDFTQAIKNKYAAIIGA